jgi:hypothetical protein
MNFYSSKYLGLPRTEDLILLPTCRRKTTNTTTMDAATGNGPLAPHMLSKIQVHCVGLIGDDALSKRICILLATSRYKAHKMLRWCGDDDMNLASPLECFWDLYWRPAGKMRIRLIGLSYSIDPMRRFGISDNVCGARGPYPAAAAAAMLMWGLLSSAVGLRRLRWRKPHIQVGIVSSYNSQSIFSG